MHYILHNNRLVMCFYVQILMNVLTAMEVVKGHASIQMAVTSVLVVMGCVSTVMSTHV